MWTYTNQNELYHHGVLGMKWGVRRYQNKDGTRTALGKRRRASESGSGRSFFGKKKKPSSKNASEAETKPKKKKISEMTDDELRQEVNRMTLEKQAYDLQKQLSQLNPKTLSRGEKFVKGLKDVGSNAAKKAWDDVILPTASDYAKKELRKQLGLDKEDTNSLDYLKKQADKKRYQKQIKELDRWLEDEKNGKHNGSSPKRVTINGKRYRMPT